MQENNVTTNKKMSNKIVIAGAVLLVLVLAIAAFAYRGYTKSEGYTKKKAAAETAETLKDVSKLMILPSGQPSIFAVEDPEKLVSQQAFFAGSIKGDQLLVYPEAGKAIIYSPSRGLIVNVGPVTFDDNKKAAQTAAPAPVATSTKTATTPAAKATTTKR
jgi:hypothetical protein